MSKFKVGDKVRATDAHIATQERNTRSKNPLAGRVGTIEVVRGGGFYSVDFGVAEYLSPRSSSKWFTMRDDILEAAE